MNIREQEIIESIRAISACDIESVKFLHAYSVKLILEWEQLNNMNISGMFCDSNTKKSKRESISTLCFHYKLNMKSETIQENAIALLSAVS